MSLFPDGVPLQKPVVGPRAGPKPAPPRNVAAILRWLPFALVAVVGLAGLVILAPKLNGVLILLGFAALAGTLLMVVNPDLGTLLFLVALYLNLSGVATTQHGASQVVAAAPFVLIVIPVATFVLLRGYRFLIDYTFLGMLLFLACVLLSTFVVRDSQVAMRWIFTYVEEGLLLYLLVLNAVRSLGTLRRALWVLMLAGSTVASMSLYQELTHRYEQQFWGLATRNIENGVPETRMSQPGSLLRQRLKLHISDRAAGPVVDPNRYAQILLILLPIAFFRMRDEKAWALRLLAAILGVLLLAGTLVTFSRGGFLGLLAVVACMVALRYVRLHQLLLTCVVLVGLVAVAAPGYVNRMDSIRNVTGIFSRSTNADLDGATRGRLTEMLAAGKVFLDYPLTGVGPGQFTPFYSLEYMNDPSIAYRSLEVGRRAHNLFLELAAETGLLGISCFLGIALLVVWRLWRARRRWLLVRPEIANLPTALLFSMVAYFATAFFLHLSFQRYYWMLLALCGATIQILGASPPRAAGGDEPLDDPVR